MYRYIFYCLLVLFACSNSDQQGNSVSTGKQPANIQIQVDHAPDGPVYLVGQYETQTYRADSTGAKSGKIVFAQDSLYPSGLYFVFFTNQKYFQLILDKDQEFTIRTNYNDFITATEVEGCIDNELLYHNLKFQANQQPKFDSLNQLLQANPNRQAEIQEQQYALIDERKAHLKEIFDNNPNSFFTVFKKAGQNPDPVEVKNPDGTLNTQKQVEIFRQQYWEDVDFSNEGLLRTPVIANKIQKHFNELTVQHPDSILRQADFLMNKVATHPAFYGFFANWITLNYEPTKTTLMDPEAVYTHMVQNYFTYEKAFWSDSAEIYSLRLRAEEMAGSLIGNKALDVTAPDVNGNMQTLLKKTAPYLVVYLFNPTCDHCMIETPKLKDFYNQWKNRGVDVYSIGVDTEMEEWKNYVTEQQLPFTSVFDPTYAAIYGKYFVDITPEIYVLNPDRIIIAKNLKVDQIETIINRDKAKG